MKWAGWPCSPQHLTDVLTSPDALVAVRGCLELVEDTVALLAPDFEVGEALDAGARSPGPGRVEVATDRQERCSASQVKHGPSSLP